MFRFFRHIRQRLLREGKVGTFLKYALGEILLVVIGILIALSIDGWNEERKQQLRSRDLHVRLAEDLQRIVSQSAFHAENTNSILHSITATQRYLERGGDLTPAERDTVDYAMLMFPRSSYQLPTFNTYEEMKSNGDLGLIYDVALRDDLADFASYLVQVETIYSRLSAAIESDFIVFNRHVRAHVDPNTLKVSNQYNLEAMTADPNFINTFSRMAVHWRGFTYFMNQVNRMSERLLEEYESLKVGVQP